MFQLCAFHSFREKWKCCSLPLTPGLMWLLLILSLPTNTNATTIRVGVVGPWSCDPLFGKALPHMAAQLAVDRMNSGVTVSLPSMLEVMVLQEDCSTSQALSNFASLSRWFGAMVGPINPGYCGAASLLAHSWNTAVFSWACISEELDSVRRHPSFARTLPSPTAPLLTLLHHFRWNYVGIISTREESWVQTAGQLAFVLRAHGLSAEVVAAVSDDPDEMRDVLSSVWNRAVYWKPQVLLLCMHSVLIGGATQKLLLETAYDLQMTQGSLVFVTIDTLLYALPYREERYPVLRNNSKLLRAYDAVLTLTLETEDVSFFQAFQEALDRGELHSSLRPQEVSPLFGTIYDSIIFVAHAMRSLQDSGMWPSWGQLARHTQDLTFYGFSRNIRTDSSGKGLVNYVVLDTDGRSWELYATHRLDMESGMVLPLGREIHFPHSIYLWSDISSWILSAIFSFRAMDPLYAAMICAMPLLLLPLLYCVRKCISQIKMVRGSNKILLTLEDVTFIHPTYSHVKSSSDDSRTSEMRSNHFDGDRSLASQLSSASLCLATVETSNVAVYEGDWAWLKKLPHGNFNTITTNTSDVFDLMKDLRHDNVNPFMGFFHDSGVFAIMMEFCSRGSLEDLLYSDEVKLDWMFKSSLLLDLIKGMKYLHHRNMCHGRLKSRNCVVDGRFVLKVTDYGYNEILEAQKFACKKPLPEDLLWTAPEHLRGPHPGLSGSLPGDVYSYAVIMQEVVLRGPPFCTLELSAEEIIQKVRKPPPLCRPIVPSDSAPLDCIQLIKQCWAEQPERRPTFEQIFDQFKNINKGKKTNIIDSMLRMLEQYSSNLEDLIRERTEELEIEKQKTEKLLTQMLPPSVAEALKVSSTVEPEYFDNVTLYFSDIVGFTTISANSEPIDVVDLLNDLYTLFDAIIGNHDVYKVETIGDAYMVASGLPVPNGNRHAAEISNMALDILSAMGSFKIRHMPEVPVHIRIGIHSGPCVAGVVGLTMPRYCLFGDTVNTASRMEATGMPYRIHVSHSTVQLLRELNEGYRVQFRGRTEIKGKGMEITYWLIGKDCFSKPLPEPPETVPGQEMGKDFKVLLQKAVRRLSHVRHVTHLTTAEEGNVMMHHH